MTGKVHVAVGIATTSGILALTKITDNTDTMTTLIILSALGSIFPDIDIAHSIMRKIFYGCILTAIIICGLSITQGIPIKGLINWNEVTIPIIIGFISFCGMTVYGFFTAHRTFTHTLLALILFSLSIFLMTSNITYTLFFTIGMFSHQLLDMLNKEKIYWLNPIIKKDFATYSFNSSGVISTMLFITGIISSMYFFNELHLS